MYQDNEHIAVMEPEQVNPELLEEALSDHPAKLRKLAEVIERTVNSETAKHNQQLFAEMERLNQSILDRLYEEELPENIIDEEPDNEFTHINNKKSKTLNFSPIKTLLLRPAAGYCHRHRRYGESVRKEPGTFLL